MNREELRTLSVGENIDRLVTLDMRGYGVPRILYEAARRRCGEPVCLHMAKTLDALLCDGNYIFLTTGFVFEPHKKGELDGFTGTALLIRAMLHIAEVKPVLFCEEKLVSAAEQVLAAAGVEVYSSINEVAHYPHACAVVGISNDQETAQTQCEQILAETEAAAIIAVEKPGRNEKGIYHQGTGIDVSGLCAKVDDLFTACAARGVPTFAIGDLGNEIGMGAIRETICSKIPLGDRCVCGCGGGICVETEADCLAVATTSDWACYGIISALALLHQDLGLIPTPELERKVCLRANEAGLIDGSGWVIPSIDGIELESNMLLLQMLRESVRYPLETGDTYGRLYDMVLEKNSFDEEREVQKSE